MWDYKNEDGLERSVKPFAKRNRTEVKNCFDNLEAYRAALSSGSKPQQITNSYVHSEPMGVKAVDQSGPGNPNKELRLYLFPDEETEFIHVLRMGDKESQDRDIQTCKNFVNELRREREHDKANRSPEEIAPTLSAIVSKAISARSNHGSQ